jgi:alpha-beta hydrolase superfamily lysophospholipase
MELFTQRWRPGGDPKAVLAIVHGLGEHSDRYGNIIETLVPVGYAVHAFDLRGHGRSPGQRGHIDRWEQYREDLDAFLRHVQAEEPGQPLFLMGHSLGGLIVLEYALRHPQGLEGVIASGPGLSTEGISPVAMLLGRVFSRVWPTFSTSTGLDTTGLARDPAVVDAYRNDPLVHDRGTARCATEASAAIEWTLAHAADLELPLLVIHGSADWLVPPRASQAFFDQVRLADKERHTLEGYCHEVHNDVGWEQAVATLKDWLEHHIPGVQ